MNDNEIVTEPVRIAFPALFDPKPTMKGGTDLKYQAAILFPPDYDLTPIKKCIKFAMIEKWGKPIKLKGRGMPLHKCEERDNEDGEPLAGYAPGWNFANTKSGFIPTVVDQKKQEILDEARIFAGCWVRFHLSAYTWDNEFGKGVSLGLEGVQLIREDTPLGGKTDSREVFGVVEVDDIDLGADGEDEDLDDFLSD